MIRLQDDVHREHDLLNLAVALWYPEPGDPTHSDALLSTFALVRAGMARGRVDWKSTGIHRRYGEIEDVPRTRGERGARPPGRGQLRRDVGAQALALQAHPPIVHDQPRVGADAAALRCRAVARGGEPGHALARARRLRCAAPVARLPGQRLGSGTDRAGSRRSWGSSSTGSGRPAWSFPRGRGARRAEAGRRHAPARAHAHGREPRPGGRGRRLPGARGAQPRRGEQLRVPHRGRRGPHPDRSWPSRSAPPRGSRAS